jgi:hypothetical protein
MFLLSIMLTSFSYAQACNGWGGIEAGGEIVCCSCEHSDGICPDDLAGSTVCSYGDVDCGNCDSTPPSVTWVQPDSSTEWIDGNYTFKVAATDPDVSGEITRGLYIEGMFYTNGTYRENTTGTDGSNGDPSLNAWLVYDTNQLKSGLDHTFQMRMTDLAGNQGTSPDKTVVVCNDKDPLPCENACVESNYDWQINQSTDDNEFCCGDDENEYPAKDYDFDTYGYACCPYKDDCSYKEECFRRDTFITTEEYGRLYCGEENVVTQLCEEPGDVGYVNISGECCTVNGTITLGNFVPVYQHVDNSLINHEYYFDSGCFDGLDTDCSGSVEDCEECGFEGMGLTLDSNYDVAIDHTNVDYDEWRRYYPEGYNGYDSGVVDERCCTDGINNDGNKNRDGVGCADDDYTGGYADWKCNKEIENTPLMFDLIDNDCDGNFDFGNVPYSQDGNWSNYDQDEEWFEKYGSLSSKIRLYGTVTDINDNPIPNAKVTAWLRDGWYNGLENTDPKLESMNEEHRDYFTTRADSNGNYEIYINAHMPYTFVASQPEATEARTTYDSALKSVGAEEGIISFNRFHYEWKPSLWPSDMVRCDGCNLVGSNRCYAGCMGEEKGCGFPDWADTPEEQQKLIMSCADMLSSTSVHYNETHDVLCCNGSLMSRPKGVSSQPTLNVSIRNAVTHTETVSLEGIPVKMKIVLFEKD